VPLNCAQVRKVNGHQAERRHQQLGLRHHNCTDCTVMHYARIKYLSSGFKWFKNMQEVYNINALHNCIKQ
jgi:hypothetical protein